MEAVDSAAALFEGPGGRYLARRRFAYVRVDASFAAILAWGRVEEADARELTEVLSAEEQSGILPHASLLHFRHVEAADNLAIACLGAYMAEHAPAQARVISREAVVRPDGTLGMMAAGFYEIVQAPYPVAVFASAAEALAWLAVPAGVLATLDGILAAAQREGELIHALRELLARERLDVGAAAQRLGVSERTLQRRLQEAGLSFRGELAAARMRVAQNLLADPPDLDSQKIALEAGFSSTQHFSSAFREATGVTPTEWRAKRRGV